MMKKFALMAIAVLIGTAAFAQNYKDAAGIRLGYGVTGVYKTFVNSTQALDFEAGINFPGGLGLYAAGAYEWHWSLNVDGLYVYAGPGAALGLYFGEHSAFNLGIQGVVGIEYKFPSIPLALSIDYKPTLYFLPSVGGGFANGGLGIKYVF